MSSLGGSARSSTALGEPILHAKQAKSGKLIAALVAKGLTNLQIAEAAHISNRTAENHVQHILTKLGFQNRSQIAVWATQLGHPAEARTHPL